ncbi:hypothetical protein JCM10908_000170 [Rhodotorula pacifica]|uniref:uncharacterized protein n=1 Tax=Rhodotorula pacifica TaxID=1495444 RepID=UPI0031718027
MSASDEQARAYIDQPGAPVASTSSANQGQARPLACLGNLPPELKALIVLKAVEVDLEDFDDDDEIDEVVGGDDEDREEDGWVDEQDDSGAGAAVEQRNSKRKRDRLDVGRSAREREGEEDDDGWRDVNEEEEDDDDEDELDYRAGQALLDGSGRYLRDLSDALKPTALAALSLVNHEFNELATPYLWEALDFENRANEAILECIRTILPKHGKHVRSLDFGQSDPRMLNDDVPGSGYQSADPFGHIPSSHLRIIEAAEQLNNVPSEGISSEIRHRRTRSLLMAQVIRMCPNVISIDTEMLPKTRPDWSDDLEEHDLSNPDIVYVTDHALDAVKQYLGDKLEDITLLINSDGVSTEGDLADILLACPNLLRLSVDCLAPAGPRQNRDKLYGALAGLTKLESLQIDAGEFFNDEFANEVELQCPLKVLALTECDDLSFPAFFSFVHKFSSTLECLDLDRSPHDNVERDSKLHIHRALQLPRVDTLCLATMHEPAWLLEGFAQCPIREFSLGFCPAVDLSHIEQFIDLHAPTLKRIEVQGEAALTEAQVESLEVLCHSKQIECEVLPLESSDEDSDEDGEGVLSDWEDDDDDDHGGWTDESDEDVDSADEV